MKLKDYCSKIGSGATPRGGKNSYKDVGIPLIRSQNVHDWSFRESGLAFINEEQADALCSASVLKNDVLVNITGDSVARSCIVPDWLVPARVNQHVAIIRPTPALNSTYLLAFLQAQRPLLLKLASSGATRNALTKSMLEELDVTFPPLPIQEKVAHFIGSIQSKIVLNSRINDHLAGLCESITVNTSADEKTILADISSQVTTKIAYDEAAIDSYVSTESLLPNKGGRQLASSLPTTGKVTSFKPGDTLVSNIRPYFKKVWYADRNGTCSNDVVVFRAKEPSLAPYLYSILRSDSFFEHVMAGAKGTKMPRGDKKQMMQYRVSKCCDENNLRLLSSMLGQISSNNRESGRIAELRDALLPKLMSGEIDISRIDIKQLNGHLSES